MYTSIINLIKSQLNEHDSAARVVYLELYEAIRTAIENGDLPNATRMPPTRILSEKLNFSRSTIVKAYGLLAENKLLKTRQGSGFVVSGSPPVSLPREMKEVKYPPISAIGQSFLQNIHLLNSSSSEGVAFTPGLPPIDVFPISQWQKLSNLYWRNIKTSDLNYSISSGLNSLKEHIAHYLLLTRKIKCDPNQVVIVSGSLQSLYLVGNVLIDPGDVVYLENPTFPNVISIFKSLRAEVSPLDFKDGELDLSPLEDSKARKPALIHVTPSHHYPLGGKMSREKRLALLDLAAKREAMIIENDYEHEINNWAEPIESIFSLDTAQRTIYLGTFNRILHPSIRLGYMVLPPYLLPAVKALQMHSHRFVPQSIQSVMTDFIRQNFIFKHLRNVMDEAADRKEVFLSLFEKHFDDQVRIRKVQNNSFHVLAELPDDFQDTQLVEALEARGIITHALSKCYLTEQKKQGLILGYSCLNRGFMAPFMARMARVYFGQG